MLKLFFWKQKKDDEVFQEKQNCILSICTGFWKSVDDDDFSLQIYYINSLNNFYLNLKTSYLSFKRDKFFEKVKLVRFQTKPQINKHHLISLYLNFSLKLF